MARLHRRKLALLHEAAEWPESALHFRPAQGAWCALDVLDHVARTEHEISEAMRAHLGDERSVPVRDQLRGLMVLGVMYAPTRIKVPESARQVMPKTPPDLQAAVERWDAARTHLQATVSDVQKRNTRRGIFRHPVGGWMTPGRTLQFLDSHLRHHEYQWKRLRRSAMAL